MPAFLPLFSNQIIDIVINDDGEVFIATASGIMGYKGTASAPNESYSDVYAYPNPVKDGYDGWIAVKGLVKDSDVKITDINGTLIYSTRSEGGQAVWNGKNFDGRRNCHNKGQKRKYKDSCITHPTCVHVMCPHKRACNSNCQR